MTQRVFVAVLTSVVFLAGYAARVWSEPRRPVPATPPGLAQEYARGNDKKSLDRAKLIAEIAKYRSQIDGYTAQVQEITAEFDREFAKILNPGQREKFAAKQKRRAESEAKRMANRTPLSDEAIQRERERPLTDIYWMVTVTPSLEWRTKDYALDAAQQAATRNLLTMRRAKFIALLDATEHPGIKLSRLATMMERVSAQPAEPAKK